MSQIYTTSPLPLNIFGKANTVLVSGFSKNVTSIGASAYDFDGASNPSLNLIRGYTYYFNVSATGHPFWIKTAQVTGTGSAYTNGVANNGTDSGIISITVPLNAPSTLYYICQFHGSMTGTFNVSDGALSGPVGLVSGQLDEVRFTRAVRYPDNFTVSKYSAIKKNIPPDDVCCEGCDDDEIINVNEVISTNTIFKRLGFNYNGDGIFDYGCETLAFIKSIPKLLPDWAYKDIADNNVSGYLKNPVEDITKNIANVFIQIRNTAISANVPLLAFAANNAHSDTVLFLNHTNRLSGNLTFDGSINSAYIPTFDTAISTGKIISYLVYQSDGCVTSATILGNFTSILVEEELNDLYDEIKDLPSSVTSNSSMVLEKVLIANDYLKNRRRHDETFFNNSRKVISEYDYLKRFISVDETENIIISNYLATEKLRQKDSKFNFIDLEENTYIDVPPVDYDLCRPTTVLKPKGQDCEQLPACQLPYVPYTPSLPPILPEEEPEQTVCIDEEIQPTSEDCRPFQTDSFPWFSYLQNGTSFTSGSIQQNVYNTANNNGTSLNINLGGYSPSWQGTTVNLFNGDVSCGYYYLLNNTDLYLNLSSNNVTYTISDPVTLSKYNLINNPGLGHKVFPGVCSFSSKTSSVQAKNYGRPIVCELWYSLNFDGFCDDATGYCNYSFFGSKNGPSLPTVPTLTDPNSHVKKYQAGIFHVDSNMYNLKETDFIAGVSYIGDSAGGQLKLIIKGIVVQSLSINTAAKSIQGSIDFYFDYLMKYMRMGKSNLKSLQLTVGANSISVGNFDPTITSASGPDSGLTYETDGLIDTYHCKYAWIVDCFTNGTLDGNITWQPAMFYTINVDLLCLPETIIPNYIPPAPQEEEGYNITRSGSYLYIPGIVGKGNIASTSPMQIQSLGNQIGIAVRMKPLNLYSDKEENSWYFENNSTVISKWNTEHGTFMLQLFDSRMRFAMETSFSGSKKFFEIFSDSFCDLMPVDDIAWIGVTRNGNEVKFFYSYDGSTWGQIGETDLLNERGEIGGNSSFVDQLTPIRIGAHGTPKNGNNLTARIYRAKIYNTPTLSGAPTVDFNPFFYDKETKVVNSYNNINWNLLGNAFVK